MTDHRAAGTKRLDAFVDSAFAFAATILVVGNSTSMRSFDDLIVELSRVPAFGVSLSIILSFWWAHRSFGQLATRRDATYDAISVAIMIVILIYVFPLSFMVETAINWLSDGRLPGRGLTADQIRPAYFIFGIGFAVLSGLYAALYGRLLLTGPRQALRRALWPAIKRRLANWLTGVAAGLGSMLLAYSSSLDHVVWLPSLPYLVFAILALARRIPRFQ